MEAKTEHKSTEKLMPVLFIGHGNPMNALEKNEFSDEWRRIVRTFPCPKAILCISAHWSIKGTKVTAMERPKTIYDFGGFPDKLYAQKYPAPGSPALSEIIYTHLGIYSIGKDYHWGLDHGTWSFLKHMYPDNNVPVVQMSIDHTKSMKHHYRLGKELLFLRKMGVLITGSGNIIHNLRLAKSTKNGFDHEFAYNWALELNELLKERIIENNSEALMDYGRISKHAYWGIPSEEHYIPLIYALALKTENDRITIFNDKVIGGAISMTSFIISH
ncbi:MAG: 4,5-DOPA dioxygenase extradiol [Bacteroidales bacterium]|jgi:4,5-DOPA dioxygenase extradiol|nr:4,5-DOPA dioxygenase extradiol [Bacteroidales bacterium]